MDVMAPPLFYLGTNIKNTIALKNEILIIAEGISGIGYPIDVQFVYLLAGYLTT
jgi:hypothetical protein